MQQKKSHFTRIQNGSNVDKIHLITIMEFHLDSFIILLIILILVVASLAFGFKVVKCKSCGRFLLPLKENLKGDHFYIIGFHSNQLVKPVPKFDITVILLSATAKHQVIVKHESNNDETLLRLGTTLILSGASACLGNIESMSLLIHGDPKQWKLEWIKVMDVQHSLTWYFKLPGDNLIDDKYIICSYKGQVNKVQRWLRFHNWILLNQPNLIHSRIGYLTLIYLITSMILTTITVTMVASYIVSDDALILVCVVTCFICLIVHMALDIQLHLSVVTDNQTTSTKWLRCFPDEWQNALPSARRVCEFRVPLSEATLLSLKSQTSPDTSKSESVVSLPKEGIQVVRQIPVEDFSIYFQAGDSESQVWPAIIHYNSDPKTRLRDASSTSADTPAVFFNQLEGMVRAYSVGGLSSIGEESDPAVSKTPPSFGYSSYSPAYKKSAINILNPSGSSESENLTSSGTRTPKYGYVYTFLSKTSLITIREPIAELSEEEEAAFIRVSIPNSDSDAQKSQVVSSTDMLIQDTTGTIWIPKKISNLEKKQHMIRFFRHWEEISSFLQVMDLRLGSLLTWYTQQMLMSNEIIAIERIRVEVLRLLIIFQVSKRMETAMPTTKTRSVPLYGARSAARFTATERPPLDEYFQRIADLLENFTIQVAMLVINTTKDFVSVTRGAQLHLSGTVQYDLQSIVKYFIEEIQSLHDMSKRRVRANVSVGDRAYISPHVPLNPQTASGVASSSSIYGARGPFGLKSTRSLLLTSKVAIDSGSYFSATDVPPELEEPMHYSLLMSAEVLTDVARFVEGIVSTVKDTLGKETAGNSLYDFLICRTMDTDKNFRFCCHDFLLYLVNKLSQCIAENVINVLGKELHLHVRNVLTGNLIRVVQFVVEKLPDIDSENFNTTESNEKTQFFPIYDVNESIEVLFRECVVKNCVPPANIQTYEELQHYKHDLWLLKLVDRFVQHPWLDRCSASIMHLVSKAMPTLHNKLTVSSKIVNETLSLVEIVEEDINNSGNVRPIPLEHKDFASIMASLHKRLNSVQSEMHSCFHELNKIYQFTKLSQAEQEYMDRLASKGVVRTYDSETLDPLLEAVRLDSVTLSSIIEIRDAFLLLPGKSLSPKWHMASKTFLVVNSVACYVISLIFSFLFPTSAVAILCVICGTVLTDAIIIQNIKTVFLDKLAKRMEYARIKQAVKSYILHFIENS